MRSEPYHRLFQAVMLWRLRPSRKKGSGAQVWTVSRCPRGFSQRKPWQWSYMSW